MKHLDSRIVALPIPKAARCPQSLVSGRSSRSSCTSTMRIATVLFGRQNLSAARGDPARDVHLGCSTRELVTPPNRASPQQKRTFRVSSSTPTDRFHERVGRERIRGVPWHARGGHQDKFLEQAFCPSVQIDTRIATSARLSVSPRGTSPCRQSPCVCNVPA